MRCDRVYVFGDPFLSSRFNCDCHRTRHSQWQRGRAPQGHGLGGYDGNFWRESAAEATSQLIPLRLSSSVVVCRPRAETQVASAWDWTWM